MPLKLFFLLFKKYSILTNLLNWRFFLPFKIIRILLNKALFSAYLFFSKKKLACYKIAFTTNKKKMDKSMSHSLLENDIKSMDKEKKESENENAAACNDSVELLLYGKLELQENVSCTKTPKRVTLKQQSLYTIWNIVRFLAIGIFVLLASFKRQDLLNSFYDNEDQCCYCLVNAQDESVNRRIRLEWS
ncbi:hypothetical protein RFI_23693, partial [Reticulomyxa filosa]